MGATEQDEDAGKHLPFDSQSAQYLFSSSASKEFRTAWYLSTSFTDLPVIVASGPAPSQHRRSVPGLLRSPVI